jgi:hypothetical protein
MQKNKIIIAAFATIFVLAMFFTSGKAKEPNEVQGVPPFASFRDIPFITDKEIKAIEELQKRHTHFVYGANHTTEAFPVHNGKSGEIGGHAALLCKWLTNLFGIHFKPTIYEWGDLFAGLEGGGIHFTGDLTPTVERKKTYFMTEGIAERSAKIFQIEGKSSIVDIAKSRPPRLAIPQGFASFNYVRDVIEYDFEPIFVNNYAEAYRTIKSDRADAFLTMDIAKAVLNQYDDVVSDPFYPLIFAPVSLSTQNTNLEPVISVFQKALDNGMKHYMTELVHLGHLDYLKNEFLKRLTAKELDYIHNNAVVKILAETDNYPISFYNYKENEWQGIAFDVMRELG